MSAEEDLLTDLIRLASLIRQERAARLAADADDFYVEDTYASRRLFRIRAEITDMLDLIPEY